MLGAPLRSNPTFPFPLLPKPRVSQRSCQVPGDIAARRAGHSRRCHRFGVCSRVCCTKQHPGQGESAIIPSFAPLLTSQDHQEMPPSGCVACQTGQMLEKAPSKGTASALFSPWKPGTPAPPSDNLHTTLVSPGLPHCQQNQL